MRLGFQNRIAFNYLLATALIMAVVFGFIFFVVYGTVYRNIDEELRFEAERHIEELDFENGAFHFIDDSEWEEDEHSDVQINPMFMQITDAAGHLISKSPNLKSDVLTFSPLKTNESFNSILNNKVIRQVQISLEKEGQVKGYILTAISLKSTLSTLSSLRNVLVISFFVVLIGLFFTSRFLASRSILPIKKMTQNINRITKTSINERVDVPPTKDDLQVLAESFNELLQRIENTIKRERQFTSDASHELRTPLATLRGTLEVLIRKPRNPEEYVTKIETSLLEINRVVDTLDQLFLLAKIDTDLEQKGAGAQTSLQELINEELVRYKNEITEKQIVVNLTSNLGLEDLVPKYYTSLIIDTLISNAIKYSVNGSSVTIKISSENNRIKCVIQDEGIGIKQKDLSKIFHRFYRSNSLKHKHIPGDGLGLSIAKKSAQTIGAQISVSSELQRGSSFTILF